MRLSGSLANKLTVCAVKVLHHSRFPPSSEGFNLRAAYTFAAE